MSQDKSFISKDQVLHVAKLAKLSLTEEEVAKFTDQLSDILGYANELTGLDLSNIAPAAHPIDLENVFRQDIVAESIDNLKVLENAPEALNNQFKVPPILND
jgi:aspartyl-tRNA(Asn)/glutamyl-tRNA(Gln) amidotransferase subunit C